MIAVREYVTPAGRNPFRPWLDSLSVEVRARVQIRVLRFELGMFGAGYRVYFAGTALRSFSC